jgi:hypothetical protein
LFNLSSPFSDPLARRYTAFSEEDRLGMLNATVDMFNFGFDCYMKYESSYI